MRAWAVGAAAVLVTLGLLGWRVVELGRSGEGVSGFGSRGQVVDELPALGVVTRAPDAPVAPTVARPPSDVPSAEPVATGRVASTRARLVDEHGEPVAGVQVWALPAHAVAHDRPRWEHEPWVLDLREGWRGESAADGSLDVPWPLDDRDDPAQPLGLVLASHETQGAAVWAPSSADAGDVALTPNVQAHTVTVREGTSTLPGVSVALRVACEVDGFVLAADLLARTDEHGQARFAPVPQGALHRAVALLDERAVPVADARGRSTTLEVESPRVVSGRVVDAEGAPVADAQVTLTLESPDPVFSCGTGFDMWDTPLVPEWVTEARCDGTARQLLTGPDGCYAFADVDSRVARLTVTREGLTPAQSAHWRLDEGVITLVGNEVVDVDVVDEFGAPAGSVSCRATAKTEWGGVEALRLERTAQGWRVHDVRGRAVEVRVWADGAVGQLTIPAGADLARRHELTLEAGLALSVQVSTDGFELAEVGPLQLLSDNAWRIPQESWATAEPDAEGRYHFAGLEPGAYHLSLPLDGFYQWPIEQKALRVIAEPFVLPVSGIGHATVTRDPIVRVTLRGADVGEQRHRLWARSEGSNKTQRWWVDDDTYAITRQPGVHVLDVDEGSGQLRLDLAAGEQYDVELVVPAWPRLVGRVHDGGRGLPGATLSSIHKSSRTNRGAADDEGRFDLVLRRWTEAESLELHVMGLDADVSRSVLRRALTCEIGLDRVTELDIDLSVPGGSLTAAVLDEQGQPVAGRELTLQRLQGGSRWLAWNGAVTDPAGRARFTGLQAGSYRVYARRSTGVPSVTSESVTLEPGDEPPTLVLQQTRRAVVRGRVLRPGGSQATGWEVHASRPGFEPVSDGLDEGCFAMELAEGPWQLTLVQARRREDALRVDLGVVDARLDEAVEVQAVVPVTSW